MLLLMLEMVDTTVSCERQSKDMIDLIKTWQSKREKLGSNHFEVDITVTSNRIVQASRKFIEKMDGVSNKVSLA